ncbi:25240_t:CDS:2 [Gigaspora margarita]|uniref:25240_t:CDS:1 n=1 Tax=Gigaspora margarita TaxID=4874 RepID=A0ABN7VVX6_GIGMA|nr:25240_t:CDS:2 [Gigaspora margarita]
MKNNLKKTVLSVIGHLKIRSKKFPHILASDIEWTYVFNDSSFLSTTTSAKVISEVEFDEYLNGIKEKYTTLTSQVPQKRPNTEQNVNLHNSSNNRRSNNKSTSLNFVDVISQVQKGTSSAKTAYTEQISSSNNLASTSQNRNEEDAAFISDDDPAELVQVRIQEATPETKDKRVKNLQSAKK